MNMDSTGRARRGVYGISVASELSGISIQALRLYERKGLLSPSRSAGGTRRYSDDDLDQLKRISDLIATGTNLSAISRILHLEDRNTELETHNSRLKTDNAALTASNTRLEADKAQLEADNAELQADNTHLEADNAELREKGAHDDHHNLDTHRGLRDHRSRPARTNDARRRN